MNTAQCLQVAYHPVIKRLEAVNLRNVHKTDLAGPDRMSISE